MDVLSEAEAYLSAQGLLNSSGGVLYSSVSTLKPSPIYIIGLNPGGTEGASLAASIELSRRGNNAYLDEEWEQGGRTLEKGEARLQRRIRRIAELISINLREIPASNLVFTRSKRLGEHMGFAEALGQCLPVHEMFLRVIRPKLVFTFGHVSFFENAFELRDKESCDARHAGWKAYRAAGRLGEIDFRFGNVPHLSVWGDQSREDIMRWALEPLL